MVIILTPIVTLMFGLLFYSSQRYPNAPEGKWSSGLCNCCGHLPTCCMVFWCPCIPLGQIAQKSRLIKNGFYTVIGLFLLECVLYPINPGTLHMFKRRTGEMIDCGPAVIVISVVQIIRFCCCIALMCIAVLARRRVAKVGLLLLSRITVFDHLKDSTLPLSKSKANVLTFPLHCSCTEFLIT